MKYQEISFLLMAIIAIAVVQCKRPNSITLKNDEFSLELAINSYGTPFIKKGCWLGSNQVAFHNARNDATLEDWLPQSLVPSDSVKRTPRHNIWRIEKKAGLSKAVAEITFNRLQVAWIVELQGKGSLFRMHVRLTNVGDKDIPVLWFPIWSSTWDLPSEKTKTLTYWHALTYQPQTDSLKKNYTKNLFSKVYSSNRYQSGGLLPYWRFDDNSNSLSFSLSWCGGWQAHISGNPDSFGIKITLPSEETQLVLKPDETIDGPIINVFADRHKNPVDWRANWLAQRQWLGNNLFQKPGNWQPLIYNHWYAVRFNLNNEFISRQLEAMQPYHFDVFVVDAGWYNRVGDWTPNRRLFRKGEFENALRQVRQNGIKVGIWSCPWLTTANDDSLPPETKEARFYNKFMNAYALDLAGIDFSSRLTEHIESLKKQFQISWWKYDQELFGERARQGKMKNVIALQTALAAVRQSFADLNIENCMSGGRMINEFTDQIAQSHWIRDGGRTGLEHARSNIREALGAIQLLSPLKVQRWTNRLDEIDEDDSELLKMYCRSAMIGVWGVSTDLRKITDKQRKVILNEIDHYRVLSKLKKSLTYDILYHADDADETGVIFYDQNRIKAGVLLFRWDNKESIAPNIKFDLLRNAKYRVINVDTKEEKIYRGEQLSNGTCQVTLKAGQLSALYFVTIINYE